MKPQRWPSRTVIFSLFCLCLAGCAVESGKVYVKDGKEYGVTARQTWRARWWDYYDRGSSYAAGEYWDEAMADFQAAIRQRLEAILQELTLRQKLTQGALIDPASAAETGKSIATAEGIMIGTVTETAQSLEILARFVDVESAVVLAVSDVYGEDLTPPTVKTLVEGLVWKLQRQFPLAEGLVLEKTGKQLFTDLNERHGVKRFMKLLIFRLGQEFKHPQTGRLLKKPDVILGEARITAVSPDLSEALVLPSETLGDVRESDMVITK